MSKEAIQHYESALKEAFPSGATGDVFSHWNEARKALAEQSAQPHMTTNLHDKMLAAIDALFSASNEIEAHIAEEQLLDVRDAINKHKLAADSITEGLRLDDWPKIGCVNHDCDQCKAQQEPVALRYDGLYEYAQANRLSYNELCGIVSASLTSPQAQPAREPLTDEQIFTLLVDWPEDGIAFFDFARAIEAAHGITKGNT